MRGHGIEIPSGVQELVPVLALAAALVVLPTTRPRPVPPPRNGPRVWSGTPAPAVAHPRR